MRLLAFVFFLTVFHIEYTNAQFKEYRATISRDNPDMFYLVGSEGDSILISNKQVDQIQLNKNESFKVVYGKGRKKDLAGVRAKHKKYLVNNLNDTLIVARIKAKEYQFTDNTYLTRIDTNDGWKFVDEHDNVVYEMELFWNQSKWKYKIRMNDTYKNVDALNQYVSLSLPGWASYRSQPDNSTDDDFWFFMWLVAS